MGIPLAHFVVALALLVAGGVVGLADLLGLLGGLATLAHVHLLVAGWVCVTIAGAMTQFVPVWSGVALYSRRLATAQLLLVAVGLVGLAHALVVAAPMWVHGYGGLVLAGFWVFVYNVGRTLWRARPLDVTERHFALALSYFVVVPLMGFLLAMDLAMPALPVAGVTHGELLAAHATLAVYGAILTTVVGALYQLAPMFTQSDLRGLDHPLRRFESAAYPAGVLGLAAGRLLSHALLARVGGLLVLASLLGVAVVVARRLLDAEVDRTPMLSRYAVVVVSVVLWVASTVPAWLTRPLAAASLFGPAGAVHLLLVGVVGIVVAGTLYHVVPFIVWVNRYSDRLGLEPVPMIDDLYDGRVAAVDFVATVAGTALLVVGESLAVPPVVTLVGGGSLAVGFTLFATNLLLVVHRHGGSPLADRIAGSASNSRSE